MSHFTVTVKLTAKRLASHGGSVDKALAEMMAPYCEQTQDERYTVFEDSEDEYRKEYATEGSRKVRTPEGELLWPWDERFRVGGYGIGSDTHRVPEDCEEVTVPHRESYATFEQFVEDYHGTALDERTRRYGHWRNPNAKWDWYSIGGRWTGFYPVKPTALIALGTPGSFDNKPQPGRSDAVRRFDIDVDTIQVETRAKAEKFWSEWSAWLKGQFEPADPFDSPRSRAIDLGLLHIAEGPALADHSRIVIPWRDKVKEGDPRAEWNDVVEVISYKDFFEKYLACFNTIATYAALDNDGWHAPGKMGWFGCSSDEPDGYVKFKKEFVSRFIDNTAPDDMLVVVDCHI